MRAAVISDRLVADCDRFEPVVISVNIVQFNVGGYPGGPLFRNRLACRLLAVMGGS